MWRGLTNAISSSYIRSYAAPDPVGGVAVHWPKRAQACYESTPDGPDPGHSPCFFINRSRR